MLIQIKSWLTDKVLFEGRYGDLSQAAVDAVRIRADLHDADLHGADLHGAYLHGAYLRGADLRGADLRGAYLHGAYLRGAYLLGAYLRGADLRGADLRGADLHGAYLRGADLHGADLDSKYCFLSISPIGSENGCLWVMRNEAGVLMYNRGCFSDTEEQFVAAVKAKHAGTEYERKYMAAVEFIKSQVGDK